MSVFKCRTPHFVFFISKGVNTLSHHFPWVLTFLTEALCKYRDLKWNPNILAKKFSAKLQSFFKKAISRVKAGSFCQSENLKYMEGKDGNHLLREAVGRRFVNICFAIVPLYIRCKSPGGSSDNYWRKMKHGCKKGGRPGNENLAPPHPSPEGEAKTTTEYHKLPLGGELRGLLNSHLLSVFSFSRHPDFEEGAVCETS